MDQIRAYRSRHYVCLVAGLDIVTNRMKLPIVRKMVLAMLLCDRDHIDCYICYVLVFLKSTRTNSHRLSGKCKYTNSIKSK